jgi:hypothetical protein
LESTGPLRAKNRVWRPHICFETRQNDFQAVLYPGNEASRKKVQVVAWSDPSDVITFRVPKIGDVDVVNLYVRNAYRWFGLFESPAAAHADYAKNNEVLRVMFEGSKPTGAH